MPVTMGGMASGLDTDAIINKLVEVESQPIKKLEQSKILNNQKKEVLTQLSSQLKDLDAKAKDLYGFRASYDEKKAISSDPSVLDVTATKYADVGTTSVEVVELASNHKITSDNIDGDVKLPAGRLVIEVNGESKPVRFRGGKIKGLSDAIGEEASALVSISFVKTSGNNHIIALTSKVAGQKGNIKLSGSEELLKAAGFITGKKNENNDNVPLVFDRKFFSSYQGDAKPENPDGSIEVSGDGKSLTVKGLMWQEYELPLAVDISKETVLNFNFEYNQETEEAIPYKVETGPEEEINIKGIKLKSYNISRVRPLDEKETRKFDSLTGIGIISVEDGKRTEKIYPLETDAAKSQEIPVGRDFEGKKISRVVFYSNKGNTLFSEPVFLTPLESTGEYELKNVVDEAKNAVVKVDGIEVERDSNKELNDIIKGLVLDLKRKSDHPVEIKTDHDIEKPIEKIKKFVESYNGYIDFHRKITKAVKIDKPGESRKLDESGIFVGDMTIIRLESALKSVVSGAYQTRAEKPIKMFSQMGISTGKVNSSWESIQEGKLVIDEAELRKAIIENPEGVRMFFGSDYAGDNRVDTGMAFTLTRTLDPYISFGKNIIESKIEYEDNSIKMANERIERQEAHLKQFEEKLRRKFAAMEQSIAGSKNQQTWMNQQMGNQKQGD
jgi:flagellar hook-associated protein 2